MDVLLHAVGWLPTRDLGLAPAWYPVSFIVFVFPEFWPGGRIFTGRTAKD